LGKVQIKIMARYVEVTRHGVHEPRIPRYAANLPCRQKTRRTAEDIFAVQGPHDVARFAMLIQGI